MKLKFLRLLFSFYLFLLVPVLASPSPKQCYGKLVDPINDVDWDAIFPIRISKLDIGDAESEGSNQDLLCSCPGSVLPGIPISFNQPHRLVDVTDKPFCFPSLDGMCLDLDFDVKEGVPSSGGDGVAVYHAHYYLYPLLAWLDIIADLTCVQLESFDVAYLSELDPTWDSEELAHWLMPEGLLFANHAGVLSCVADNISTNVLDENMDFMFWCAGNRGLVAPASGIVTKGHGSARGTSYIVERLLYKLHRTGLVLASTGESAMCSRLPQFLWKKSDYRLQVVYPSLNSTFKTNRIGFETLVWDFFKNPNVFNGSFAYIVWQRRECCAFCSG